MTGPKIDRTISVGNILSIATTLVVITAGWVTMDAKLGQVDERSRQNELALRSHSQQLAAAQANEARTAERLRAIETSLVRIEAGVGDLTRYLRESSR